MKRFEVGKRYIIQDDNCFRSPIEIKVVELSPSGKWVKVKHLSNSISWEEIDDWVIIEELGE